MIDYNIYSWHSIDWQDELSAYLTALANPDASQAQQEALRINTGRCLLLMQEFMHPREYAHVLVDSGEWDMLENYRQLYINDTKKRLEAQA